MKFAWQTTPEEHAAQRKRWAEKEHELLGEPVLRSGGVSGRGNPTAYGAADEPTGIIGDATVRAGYRLYCNWSC
jgi:hypothetical protein